MHHQSSHRVVIIDDSRSCSNGKKMKSPKNAKKKPSFSTQGYVHVYRTVCTTTVKNHHFSRLVVTVHSVDCCCCASPALANLFALLCSSRTIPDTTALDYLIAFHHGEYNLCYLVRALSNQKLLSNYCSRSSVHTIHVQLVYCMSRHRLSNAAF
jgi:hypothetical protein